LIIYDKEREWRAHGGGRRPATIKVDNDEILRAGRQSKGGITIEGTWLPSVSSEES